MGAFADFAKTPPSPASARGRAAPLRLILFDLDDTLCDYATARAERLRIAFGQALAAAHRRDQTVTGLPRSPEPGVDLEALIAASIAMHPHGADHFPELLRDYGVSAEAAAQAVAWYRANRFHGLRLFPDALSTLAAVRAAGEGRRLGLITNGPADVQRAKIELLGIAPHFDFMLVSGELGIEKPDPGIFAEALRRGEATAAEALIIGDSPDHDIAGAQAVGIRAVWLNRTGRRWTAERPAPDHEVRDLAELLLLLAILSTDQAAVE